MIPRAVVRSQNAGRVDDDRVQPLFDVFEYLFRRHRLGLGIGALHLVGGEIVRFGEDAQGLFGDGVHRTDVDELFHAAAERRGKQIFRAFDVDAQQIVRHLVRDADDARRVDKDDFFVFRPFEQGREGLRFCDVSEYVFRPTFEEGRLPGQDKPAHLFALFKQQPDDRAAQMSVRARYDI